jgi:hypothetical protein
MEKVGYHDMAEIPTRAILSINVPEDSRMHAQIGVAERLAFDRAQGWTFTEGMLALSGKTSLAPLVGG